MGIRPNLHFCMAITDLQVDTNSPPWRCTDPRWTLDGKTRAAIDERLTWPVPQISDETWNEIVQQHLHDTSDSPEGKVLWKLRSARNHLRMAADKLKKQPSYNDVIVWEWEYYDPSVLAVRLDHGADLYSDDRLYALAAIVPTWHSQSQFIEIPQIDVESDMSESGIIYRLASKREFDDPAWLKKHQRLIDHYAETVSNRQNFSVFRDYFPSYYNYASYLLADCLQMKLEKKDYRLGLYFTWS